MIKIANRNLLMPLAYHGNTLQYANYAINITTAKSILKLKILLTLPCRYRIQKIVLNFSDISGL